MDDKTYFRSTIAYDVWAKKYKADDDNSPADTLKRCENEFKRAEGVWVDRINKLLRKRSVRTKLSSTFGEVMLRNGMYSTEWMNGMFNDFSHLMLGGSLVSGLGTQHLASLSNCFVIASPDDNLSGINASVNEMENVFSHRGGVGLDLSTLRPKGALIHNAAKVSEGVVSVMKHKYGESAKYIAQNGRRGALMLMLDVMHPDVLDFIRCKRDNVSVTTANISVKLNGEFMRIVNGCRSGEDDTVLIQRFPIDAELSVEDIETIRKRFESGEYEQEVLYQYNGIYIKCVSAMKIWNELVAGARDWAEPGCLFWNTVVDYDPASRWEDLKPIATNPCLTGDAMIAVADGRGYVSIETLAESGDDVPVYCLDDNNNLAIRTMRHPRVTGKKRIFEITFENGHKVKCTGNHKWLVNGKGYVETKDLVEGDSMFIMTKHEMSWKDVLNGTATNCTKYNFITTTNCGSYIPEHRMLYEYFNGSIDGKVIHHIDGNGLNNNLDNLVAMFKRDHDLLHAEEMKGDKNPIFAILADPERANAYKKAMSNATSGLRNGRAYNVTNDEYFKHGVTLANTLGRRFSKNEWIDYCNNNNLPDFYSAYRMNEFGGSFKSFSVACSSGFDNNECNPRTLRLLQRALGEGKDAFIDDGVVYIRKKCECCGAEFVTAYTAREVSFCSNVCSNKYSNEHTDVNLRRTESINKQCRLRGERNKAMQVDVYKKLLVETNGGDVRLKDFEQKCRENGVPFRFGTKYGFENYDELKKVAQNYNHKILSVVDCGYDEVVYNGTVDDFHNYFCGGFGENNNGINCTVSVNCKNCGEQPLTSGDTCRLMHYNLNTFVKERFSLGAYIDYDEMFNTFYKVMWLGDDVIELEAEAIGRIIAKLENEGDGDSPMADFWRNVQNVARFGRRVGIGISGLGDMYASLGVPYGDPEVTKKVFSTMLEALLTASTDLAVLKGEAPCFSDDDIKPLFGFGFKNFIRGLIERCVRFNTVDDMQPRDKWETFISEEFPQLWKRMRKLNRRNVSVNTVAPTGTVSLLAGITSGIEPLFMGWYRRKVKLDDSATEYDEIDQTGNKFKYYNILHEGFEDWIAYAHPEVDMGKLTDEELDKLFTASPYYLQTAHDISWDIRVLTQAVIQKYITSSISSTVNLPNDTPADTVDELFRIAYLSGCKGITVYRDGSREGVLVKKETEKPDTDYTHDVNAVKREKSLKCDVFHFYNGKERWVAFVGIQNDRPYEIFTGLEEKLVDLPTKVSAGNIVKYKRNGVNCYDFEYYTEDGEKKVVDSINTTFNPEFWNYGKMLSAMLRHRMPLVYIVKTLGDMRFENDSINSWRTGVIRALKKWIKDGTKLGEKCPECGETLVMENGCRRCPSCGWSACG